MTYMTEARRMIQASAREFSMKEVLPVANKLDPVKGDIPMDLRNKMGELGYFGIRIPEEYGGLGLGVFEYVLVTEELARAWMSVASIIARGNGFFGTSVFTDEQRKMYLGRMAKGDFLGAAALSEPDAGSDLGSIICRAEPTDEPNVFTLHGTKMWCTFADGADYITVLARTEPITDIKHRHRGTSTFFIEKPRGQLPEGCTGTPVNKIGYHGWKTWELHFDGTKALQLRGEGRGFHATVSGLEAARAHTAARAVGLARGAMEDSIQYAKNRVQFGGKPIASHQLVQAKFAEMLTQISAGQLMVLEVSRLKAEKRMIPQHVSMIKRHNVRTALETARACRDILGGNGITLEYPIMRHLCNLETVYTYEGTHDVHSLVLGQHVTGINAFG